MKYLRFILGAVCACSEVFAFISSSKEITSQTFDELLPHQAQTLSCEICNSSPMAPSKHLSSEVSLDLTGYVAPEVNIERIDDRKTLDVFSHDEAHFRITCNEDKNVIVTFNTKNNWKLLSENGNSISYQGVFKRNDGTEEKVKEDSNRVVVDKNEFTDTVFEFGTIFVPIEKNPKSGKYSDQVTISVSTSL